MDWGTDDRPLIEKSAGESADRRGEWERRHNKINQQPCVVRRVGCDFDMIFCHPALNWQLVPVDFIPQTAAARLSSVSLRLSRGGGAAH